jgi:signal transduction histidine kinase
MRPSSLARRLFLTAAAVTIVVLVVGGFVLSSLYRQAAERSFDRNLNLYLKSLVVDVATAQPGTIPEPAPLGDPAFDSPNSGWYWQIERLAGQERQVRRSPSLTLPELPSLDDQRVPIRSDGSREGYIAGPEGQRLRVIENLIDLGNDGQYVVTVAGDAMEVEDEIGNFNYALVLTFAALAAIFVGTAWFQVSFGLRPLARISSALQAIRSGHAERLEGEFPDEVAPLAREVNALIDTNREIVARARTHVGNLAHALKTPLSVLLNESASRGDTLAEKVREQAGLMRDQVQHHLERARIAARVAVPGTIVEVAPVIESIVRTMEKIHREKRIVFASGGAARMHFHGERQDLEEMVGNLVDNACKWAASRVETAVVPEDSAAFFRIVIDDDGPGLPHDARQEVLTQRGRRLDESKPGSGLGLSIVCDLAHLYGGRLELGTAPLGGLRAELVLPAAKA